MSRLPAELEYLIFSSLAHADKRLVPTLARVAQRVQRWTEPILYHTLIFKLAVGNIMDKEHIWDLKSFDYILQHKPAGFLNATVRNVLLISFQAADINRALSTFSGTQNLLLWPSPFLLFDDEIIGGPVYPSLHLLQTGSLQRLYCDFATLSGSRSAVSSLSHPAFAQLSHLSLFGTASDAGFSSTLIEERWKRLALLPSLTHLALESLPTVKTWQLIFSSCLGLRAFAVLYTRLTRKFSVEELGIVKVEQRFVMVLLGQGSYISDWLRGSKYKEDYWAQVDAHIAARISGAIDSVYLAT